MVPRSVVGASARSWAIVLGATLVLPGCAAPPHAPVVVVRWTVGQAAPEFDPSGPPDPARWALERLLSRGLVEEDSTGRVLPAAAATVEISPDELVYTFSLPSGIAFADGTPCRSREFLRSLERGIARADHATFAWLLDGVAGMDKIRPGRPLPPLGLSTPDESTLVIRLARPDSLFLRKLCLPGVAWPWREGAEGTWRDGIGDYRVASQSPGGMTLARRAAGRGLPDTIHVRFVQGAARSRALLRSGAPDLLWPVPPDLLDQPLPDGYRSVARRARPERRLLLVLRSDLPPTSKPAARHALAHALHRGDLLAALGPAGAEPVGWLPGGGRFEFPRRDPEAVRAWLERGKLGRSLHAVLAYSADGAGGRVARAMQVEWARLGLDVELRPLRHPGVVAEQLRRGGAQLRLVEGQSLLDTPTAELAALVQPLRGPGVGPFRTGWTTREFDRWIVAGSRAPALDPAWAQQRLEDERIAIPLAELPWLWVQRTDRAGGFHPHFGPEPRAFAPPAAGDR